MERAGATVAVDLAPGIEYVVLLHALMKPGAVSRSSRQRPPERGRASPSLSAPRRSDGKRQPGPGDDRGRLPLLGEHDLDALHCRILTSGSGGRPTAHLREPPLERSGLRVQPRRRAHRPLALLPAPFHVGGLSIVMRSVIYGTTAVVHHGFDVDWIASSLEGDGVTLLSLVSTSADPPARGRRRPAAPLRAVLVGGGLVPEEALEEAIGRARRWPRPTGSPRRHRRARRASGRHGASLGQPGGPCSPPICGSRRGDPRPGPHRGPGHGR